MNIYIEQHKNDFQTVINHFREELKHIRTGHASPELVESIMVNAYGSHTPIKQLASIAIPEPKLIVIQPWDKSIIKDIEKAIVSANLGFNAMNDGNVVRVPMPPLTEENRKELVKIINERTEKSRVSLRQTRDKVKETILAAEKNKEVAEDDRYRFLRELDEFVSKKTDEVNEIAQNKEVQIMKI